MWNEKALWQLARGTRAPYGMCECPWVRMSLLSQVTCRERIVAYQQRIVPVFDDACLLASGIQWTVLCLRAKSLESGWERQMWLSLSQWHWRELINTQFTGSSLMGLMLRAGHVWGCEWGAGLRLGILGVCFDELCLAQCCACVANFKLDISLVRVWWNTVLN